MRNHIRFIVYLVLAFQLSLAVAGSFEDFFIYIRNDNATALADLLKRGFDVNTRDERGQSGLVLALQEQSPKAIRLLLAQPGIDIEAVNKAGESALMMAALKGDQASVALLLDRGALVDRPGWTPLHYAATGPEPALVRLFIDRGARVDAASPNGSMPLMMAAQYGAEDSVDLLLQHGADRERTNDKGLRAIDFAKLAGRDYLLKRLTPGTR